MWRVTLARPREENNAVSCSEPLTDADDQRHHANERADKTNRARISVKTKQGHSWPAGREVRCTVAWSLEPGANFREGNGTVARNFHRGRIK